MCVCYQCLYVRSNTARTSTHCVCALAVFLPVNGHSQQRRTKRGAELLCLASSGEASSADSSSGVVDRRALLSGGLALAAATALQSSLPANAGQVVSSDWEKVALPVDPGVVLLDIGFTDEKHGARLPLGPASFMCSPWCPCA